MFNKYLTNIVGGQPAMNQIFGNSHSFHANAHLFRSGKFSLSAAVGDSRRNRTVRNRPTDVYAVQVALTEIHQRFPVQILTTISRSGKQYSKLSADPGPITGTMTRKTQTAISNLQRWFLPHTTRPTGVFATAHGVQQVPSNLRADVYGQRHPSEYTFLCLRHLLQSASPGQTPPALQWGARSFVNLLQTKVGQPYVLGASVPKDFREWMGPWDCAEFICWGLMQTIGNRFRVLFPGRFTTLGSSNKYKTTIYNNVRFYDASVVQFHNHMRLLERTSNEVVRVTDHDKIRSKPGLIGINPNGTTPHIIATNGRGGTIEAISTTRGVGSRTLGPSILRNFQFWELECLYMTQAEAHLMAFHTDSQDRTQLID